jgi:hypothetical protein
MDSLQRYQKRVRDEVAAVEKEIQSHSQQLAALNQRLEGLKRAVALFKSEQSAMVELLRTNTTLAEGLFRDPAIASTATAQNAGAHRNATPLHSPSRPVTQTGRGNTKTVTAHPAGRKAGPNGGLKRKDMIAAVLKRHRGLSLRELIAALDKEFGWKSTESHVTNLLYTNQKKFAHTQPDRAANRPVTWSLK